MADLDRSYAYAARVTRAHARNFYSTFRFLPPERRRSIFAVYAFSRRCDDAVDDAGARKTPEEAERILSRLDRLLEDPRAEDPLAPALQDTIARYEIPLELFRELIAGMRMDLEVRRYPRFEDLYLYCYRAASVIGLISVRIFGFKDEEVFVPAEALGIAMQLTNILRDIPEDLERDRIYIPLEDLARFRYREEDLRARVLDDRFRALMRFEIDRARSFFHKAEPLFPLILEESRWCPVLLKRVYGEILTRIERRGFDVFSRRPSVPLYTKLRLVAATWLEARRGALPVPSGGGRA